MIPSGRNKHYNRKTSYYEKKSARLFEDEPTLQRPNYRTAKLPSLADWQSRGELQ